MYYNYHSGIMNRLKVYSEGLRKKIKDDYCSGMIVRLIADKYGFKDRRNVYYHLNPLTQEEKTQHFMNKMAKEDVVAKKVDA